MGSDERYVIGQTARATDAFTENVLELARGMWEMEITTVAAAKAALAALTR